MTRSTGCLLKQTHFKAGVHFSNFKSKIAKLIRGGSCIRTFLEFFLRDQLEGRASNNKNWRSAQVAYSRSGRRRADGPPAEADRGELGRTGSPRRVAPVQGPLSIDTKRFNLKRYPPTTLKLISITSVVCGSLTSVVCYSVDVCLLRTSEAPCTNNVAKKRAISFSANNRAPDGLF